MSKTVRIIVGALAIAAGPALLAVVAAYTLAMPRTYIGESKVQVVFPSDMRSKYDASALARLTETQVELISSAPQLTAVAEALGLRNSWGTAFGVEGRPLEMSDCRAILSKSIRTDAIPNAAGLISIRVYREDPDEAARIANELAAAYHRAVSRSPQQGGMYQVTVVSPAEPSFRAVSPNIPKRTLISVAIACVVSSLGVAMVVRARKL